jgi:FkbM family methyltransferase
MSDRETVWNEVAVACPEFTHEHDVSDNFHAVGEIVLGGSLTWKATNNFFYPRPGKRVMDVGANAGIYSAFCGIHGASVDAYEPFPEVYDLLKGMVGRTGLAGNVKTHNKAIWTYTGSVAYIGHRIVNPDVTSYNGGLLSSGVHWTTADFDRAIWTDCISFEDAIGGEEWDCVKMDVEGAEFEILLATPEEALRKIKFMYAEFHDWAEQDLHDETMKKLRSIFNVHTFRGQETMPKYECVFVFRKGIHE